MSIQNIRYFVFDIESVADPNLVARLKYNNEYDGATAVSKWREELMQEAGSDFIPYTYHIPTTIAIGKVGGDYKLQDVVVLGESEYKPHKIVELFWRGWERYGRPTLVSFNGRGFDVPLLELSAFRYGISLPGWFQSIGKSFEQPRNRYNTQAHLDLCDFLTNYGATRFTGGLNLAANLIGKPGKMDIKGCMVQDMHDEGRFQEIDDYCRCDVLDTYFVFLRTRVISGFLTIQQEQNLVVETKHWLEEQAEKVHAYQMYLENWGEWDNPWRESPE